LFIRNEPSQGRLKRLFIVFAVLRWHHSHSPRGRALDDAVRPPVEPCRQPVMWVL